MEGYLRIQTVEVRQRSGLLPQGIAALLDGCMEPPSQVLPHHVLYLIQTHPHCDQTHPHCDRDIIIIARMLVWCPPSPHFAESFLRNKMRCKNTYVRTAYVYQELLTHYANYLRSSAQQ